MSKSGRGFAEKDNTMKVSRSDFRSQARGSGDRFSPGRIVTLGTSTTLAAMYIGIADPDLIFGSAGKDLIDGRGGNDRIAVGGSVNTVHGGPGNDFIRPNDWLVDRVDYGLGLDTITSDFVPLRQRNDYAKLRVASLL